MLKLNGRYMSIPSTAVSIFVSLNFLIIKILESFNTLDYISSEQVCICFLPNAWGPVMNNLTIVGIDDFQATETVSISPSPKEFMKLFSFLLFRNKL